MSITSLPIEILYNIIEAPVLINRDIKNLRKTCSLLSGAAAPALFKEIRIEFKDEIDSSSKYRMRVNNVLSKIERLQNLKKLKNREMAKYPTRLCLIACTDCKPLHVSSLLKEFCQVYAQLLRTFKNIRDVSVELKLDCMRLEDAVEIMQTICREQQSSSLAGRLLLHVSLWELRSSAREVMEPLKFKGVAESLRSLKLSSGIADKEVSAEAIELEVVQQARCIIKSCHDLRHLELHDFGHRLNEVFTETEQPALQSVQHLVFYCHQGTYNQHRGHITAQNMRKFSGLKDLEIFGNPPSTEQAYGFWDVLSSMSKSVKLERLAVSKLDMDLLSYLSSPENSCNIRVLELDIFLMGVPYYDQHTVWEHAVTTCAVLNDALYLKCMQNVQENIQRLVIRDVPAMRWYAEGNHFVNGWWGISSPYSLAVTQLFDFKAHFHQFDYNFPRLKELRVCTVYREEGDIAAFMKCILCAPKLHSLDLLIYINGDTGMDELANMAEEEKAEKDNRVADECVAAIGAYRDQDTETRRWRQGLTLHMTIRGYREYHEVRGIYEWQGDRWIDRY